MQCNWVVVVFPGGSSTRQLQIGIRYTLPDVHVLHPKIHPSWLCVCSAMANQQSQADWAIPTAMLQLLCHGFAMTTFPLFGWSVVRAENQINTKHSPLTSLTTLSLYNSSPMLHQHNIIIHWYSESQGSSSSSSRGLGLHRHWVGVGPFFTSLLWSWDPLTYQ